MQTVCQWQRWACAAESITLGRASGKLYLSVLSSSFDAGVSLPSTLSPQAAACAITLGGIQLLNGGINPVNASVHLHACKACYSATHARLTEKTSIATWCKFFGHQHSRTWTRAEAYWLAFEDAHSGQDSWQSILFICEKPSVLGMEYIRIALQLLDADVRVYRTATLP